MTRLFVEVFGGLSVCLYSWLAGLVCFGLDIRRGNCRQRVLVELPTVERKRKKSMPLEERIQIRIMQGQQGTRTRTRRCGRICRSSGRLHSI